ncbi:MAG: dihydropteroate synthase-like protein [Ignisphaera sp.]
MARVLVVTGRLAEPIVRRTIASISGYEVDVFVAPVDVASFMTVDYIAKLLAGRVHRGDYEYIIIPGLVKGSGRVVEAITGIKTVKGPINAVDLSDVFRVGLEALSPDKPADEVLQSLRIERCRKVLTEVERMALEKGFIVGGIYVALEPPPIRVASEIFHSYTLTDEELIRRVSYLVESGADIISLGFEALEPHPDEVYRVVRAVKRVFDVPIAIDTSIPSEILRGVEAGADMVINIDLTNIENVKEIDKSIAVVVIPRNPIDNSIPRDYRERVDLLLKTVDVVKSHGFEKVFADAILEPVGNTFKSLQAYAKFREVRKDIPLFMGIGNVTELIDADSVGVNAILVGLAHEIGVSIVLTVEQSNKAKGSTKEVKIATQMMAIANMLGVPPKDLGISLLILKDKRRYDTPMDSYEQVVYVEDEDKPYRLDPMGIFKIRVNHEEGYIEALYIGRKGRILLRGRTAKAIRNKIVELELVSQVSHALYLGAELAKAEEALKLGKNYIQEQPLFIIPKPVKTH